MVKLSKALIKGSLFLLITFNIYNALNFFFHFSMARLLSIVDYGILVTLFSIIYILAIFSESIQTVITKYSSAEESPGKLKNLFKKALRKASFASLSLFALYLIISVPLSYLFKIDYLLMAFNGLMIFAAFFVPVSRGIMQGKKMFKSLGLNMIIEAVIKLVLAIALVLIGWKVYGAIAATILGTFVAFLFSFPALRRILKSKEVGAKTKDIYNYSKPVFFLTFIILIFYSIDVIIAKMVFTPEMTGYYAIASTLGKTIFFGTLPISKAMFPLSAAGKKKKDKPSTIFGNALAILILLITVALVAFIFFPELIIRIFSGRFIPESAAVLFLVGIAVSLISLSNLILLYKISTGKTKGYLTFSVFLLIEIFLLVFFSQSLLQFSMAFITASAILLWGSIFLLNE